MRELDKHIAEKVFEQNKLRSTWDGDTSDSVLEHLLAEADELSENDYGFNKSVRLSKGFWDLLGGDERFSHAYLEMFGDS